MRRPMLPASAAVLLSAFLIQAPAKPCAAPPGVSPENLLELVQIARGIAGTEGVELDQSRSCIVIGVRTPGTARLVELLLRGVDVPAEAVRFQVDSSALPGGGSRRT